MSDVGPGLESGSKNQQLHIAVLGPSTPAAFVRFLPPDQAKIALRHAVNAGTAVNSLVGRLLDEGHRVTLVSHQPGEAELRLNGPRFTLIRVPSRSRAREVAFSWWKGEREAMTAALHEAQPDIVHAHWTYEFALAALQSGYPTVITARDAPLTVLRIMPDGYRVLRTLLAYYVRVRAGFAHVVIAAVSPYMASRWHHQMLWARRVPILPNMVALSDSASAEKSKVPQLIEIADSGPRKNVRLLLVAFGLVKKTIPQAELVLIGTGLGQADDLAAWAQERGLREGVHFLGSVPHREMLQWLASSWIHVHASIEESFGNTLIEAMSVQTMVIAGERAGAVGWVLGEGQAGILTNVRNAQSVASEIIKSLQQEGLRDTFVHTATDRLNTEFSPERIAFLHVDLYRRVIRSVKPRSMRGALTRRRLPRLAKGRLD